MLFACYLLIECVHPYTSHNRGFIKQTKIFPIAAQQRVHTNNIFSFGISRKIIILTRRCDTNTLPKNSGQFSLKKK